jgi:hypothetical protein
MSRKNQTKCQRAIIKLMRVSIDFKRAIIELMQALVQSKRAMIELMIYTNN